MNPTTRHAASPPTEVHDTLARHMLADGYDMVLDLEKSQGRRLWDARAAAAEYLDMFSFFATLPLGLNHPKLKDPEFLARSCTRAALVEPDQLRHLHDRDGRVRRRRSAASAMPAYLPHVFFVAGGALGVENALKAAIDWKVRRNFAQGHAGGEGPPGPALPRGLPRPHRLHAVA